MPYPTSTDYTFDEGIDPTATFSGPEATTLLTFERLALPNSYRGLTIYDDATPTTSGEPGGYPTDWYAWQKRCVWIQPTSGEIAVYRTGLGWVHPTLGVGVVDTANIADGAVTPAKISPGTATYILRTNAAGTACEFAALSTILSAGSVPLSAISSTGASAILGFMRSNGSTNYWGALSAYDINLAVGGGGLSITALNQGTARYVLTMNSAGTSAVWTAPTAVYNDNELPLTKISPGSGNANKVARVNAAGTALEFATPASVPVIAQYTSGSLSIPAAGASVTATHGMASRPVMWSAEFICTTGEAGYSVGDSVDANEVDGIGAGGDHGRAYTASVNATIFSLVATTGWSSVEIGHKTTGVFTTFTPANWALVFKGQIITP